MSHTVSEIMVQELCELRNKLNRLERSQDAGHSTGTQARADSATATPEIQQLERALASRKREEELRARAPAGGMYWQVGTDTGRVVRRPYGADDAFWKNFCYAPRSPLGSHREKP